jgi:hypothetical protein
VYDPCVLRGLALIALVSGAGCSVVTPPPVMPSHDLAQPLPEGTTTISLVLGYALGVWIDDGGGALLRVGHQVDERNQLGVDISIGWRRWSRKLEAILAEQNYQSCTNRDRESPDDFPAFNFSVPCNRRPVEAEPGRLIGVRGWLRWTIDPERAAHAAVVGAGFTWVDNGMRTLTLDTGYLSSTGHGTIDAYGGPQLALAIPLVKGPAFYGDKRPATTIYVGAAGGGLLGGKDHAVSGSLELTALWGFSVGKDAVFILGGSTAGTWRSDAR